MWVCAQYQSRSWLLGTTRQTLQQLVRIQNFNQPDSELISEVHRVADIVRARMEKGKRGDEDDEDEEEAEDGYDDIVERDKGYIREEGTSARDIEDRMRRKGMWELVLSIHCIF